MKRRKWTDVFATFPDNAFFELVRHYIGPVATPFHKPELVERLGAFLGRDDVIEQVLDFIDPSDAAVLTCIAFHPRPTALVIERILQTPDPGSFRGHLLNLEERLLIWIAGVDPEPVYSLTPLGETVRDRGLLGPGCLLGPGTPVTPAEYRRWFDDTLFTSVLAFLAEGIPIFLREGGWRRKSLDLVKRRFPRLFAGSQGEERILLVGRTLLAAGLAVRRGDEMIPVLPAWRELEGMDFEKRRICLLTRCAAGRSMRIEDAVGGIRMITEYLPAGRSWFPGELAALFGLGVTSGLPPPPRISAHIISRLVQLGELHAEADGRLSRPLHRGGRESTAAAVTVTPTGDITLNPHTRLLCDVALAAEPVSVDIVATFRLERKAFIRGLDRGVRREDLFDTLERESARPLPANLRVLADEWETDYRSVNLCTAVVLRVDGFRRHIIEETGILERQGGRRIAEGVWLLDASDEQRWRIALAEVGIENLPPVGVFSGDRPEAGRPLPAALPEPARSMPPAAAASWEPPILRNRNDFFESLTAAAESAGFTPDEMQEFRERRDRRLILSADQVRRGAWRYEVTTARGLDYPGKIRLIEAALEGRNERLEISMAAKDGVRSVQVVPVRLERHGSDHVLSVRMPPEMIEEQIRVRKIVFIRRIRTSLL